jgi:ankyrin repeat protein
LLLSRRDNGDARDGEGTTGLMLAATGGHYEVAAVAVASCWMPAMQPARVAPDTVSHRDSRDRVVLSHLSWKKLVFTGNYISALFDLIDDLAVDVNSTDQDGNTALHYAILTGCPGMVRCC